MRPLKALWALPFLALPVAVQAQSAATLLADHVTVSPAGQLVAEGNVEVFFGGTRLTATRITYSQAADQLSIDGPIFIVLDDGTLLTADRADLDPTLENGLLISARMVLEEQLQMAANRIDRVDGRYTQLSRVAATSCSVCDGRAPLWDIRADTILHDEEARQLYLTNAVLRVRGVPVFWVPSMRLPDPSLSRATGFLVPEYRSNDLLGTGFKFPYFIRMGDHRDLTLKPYFSGNTNTLEARYRQAFVAGDIAVNGAISEDTLADGTRGYISVEGKFDLANDFVLSFYGITVSDRSYLQQYGYSDADRLESTVKLERYKSDGLVKAELAFYQSLLSDESTFTLPPVIASVDTERSTAFAGGTMTFELDADLHLRFGPDTGDDDRDVGRLGAAVDWARSWVTDTGLVIDTETGIQADVWTVTDDPVSNGGSRYSPSATVSLRYPMIRTGQRVVDLVEPIVMVGWAGDYGDRQLNEDSIAAEFDEANLFRLSRFPGDDRIEPGFQAAYGLSWYRSTPNGQSARLIFGQVLREEPADFSDASGLNGQSSDLLFAGQFNLSDGLYVLGRVLTDPELVPGKSEVGIGWNGERIDLEASYIWLPADDRENRTDPVSEWTFGTEYRVNDVWTVGLAGRYDVATESPVSGGLSLGWRNECVDIELSASRRYTSSTNVAPTTDYGLTIGLAGFGTGTSGVAARRTCTN